MSKSKIIAAWKEAVAELSEVPAETVKKLERPFTDLRSLHSDTDRRRQEAEDLSRKQADTITALERTRSDLEAVCQQQQQMISRLTVLVTQRIGGYTLKEKSLPLLRRFELDLFDYASRLGLSKAEWDAFHDEFNRQVHAYYQQHHDLILDELNFMYRLLAACCRQYGPVRLTVEQARTPTAVTWGTTETGQYELFLVSSQEQTPQEETKQNDPAKP